MQTRAGCIRLADGSEVVVRAVAVPDDLERLLVFFRGLPAGMRGHLRYDVTERDPLRSRLVQLDGRDHWRLLAESDGIVVGDATLDREPYGWTRHVAGVRVVVHPDMAHLHVAQLLLNGLLELGAAGGVERLTCEVADTDQGCIQMLEEAGFVREALLRAYAKGPDGRFRDLVLMTNDVEDAWRHLGEQLEELDVRAPRSA